MLVEVAPLQVRRTVFIPPTLRPLAPSVNAIGGGAQYLPPVFKEVSQKWIPVLVHPPQTIISLPLHTTVYAFRAEGALVTLVAVQLPVLGLYLPPVFTSEKFSFSPPQTIISPPVHTALCPARASGALVLLVATQLSVLGLYLPPVFNSLPSKSNPPQTIISVSVHTAVCALRAEGALVVLVAFQLSVLGLYLPPVFKLQEPSHPSPPQMIISFPVQTAVCPTRPAGALVVLVAVQLSVLGLYLPPVVK